MTAPAKLFRVTLEVANLERLQGLLPGVPLMQLMIFGYAINADGQFIAGVELAFKDTFAVDPDAIGTRQVTDHKVILDLSNATVAARHLA